MRHLKNTSCVYFTSYIAQPSLDSPQSVSGQDYQWFGAVGGEMGKVRGGRRVLGQAMPWAGVLSVREGFQANRMELDFPVQKAAHRSINLSLLPRFLLCFFPPYFHCFVFLAAEIPLPFFFSLSPFSPPSFPWRVCPWARAKADK